MHLSPRDEAEYDALMVDAIGEGTSKITAEMAERVLSCLLDAEQAGRRWASEMLDVARLAGCRDRAKRWRASHTGSYGVAYNGTIVTKPRVVGVLRRSNDGGESWQRQLWEELTWAEVEERVSSSLGRIGAERINLAIAEKLLQLRDKMPDSIGPADACRQLNTSIDRVLSAEAQAAS